MAPSHDLDDDEDHGGLVKKILETKKELEGGSQTSQARQPKRTEIVSANSSIRDPFRVQLDAIPAKYFICPNIFSGGSRFFRFDIQIFRNVAASGVGAPPPQREILDPLLIFAITWAQMSHILRASSPTILKMKLLLLTPNGPTANHKKDF